jgi:hypothetical protein
MDGPGGGCSVGVCPVTILDMDKGKSVPWGGAGKGIGTEGSGGLAVAVALFAGFCFSSISDMISLLMMPLRKER